MIEVDSRGRRCPLPIIDLAKRLPSVAVGAVRVTMLALLFAVVVAKAI